mmetsp:Transcript_102440/g.305982  ORF Transcript_102440/g.305982 Transcript_102440/m.305982 type:complete len:253 (+) Transcript_102440:580-1338(+)
MWAAVLLPSTTATCRGVCSQLSLRLRFTSLRGIASSQWKAAGTSIRTAWCSGERPFVFWCDRLAPCRLSVCSMSVSLLCTARWTAVLRAGSVASVLARASSSSFATAAWPFSIATISAVPAIARWPSGSRVGASRSAPCFTSSAAQPSCPVLAAWWSSETSGPFEGSIAPASRAWLKVLTSPVMTATAAGGRMAEPREIEPSSIISPISARLVAAILCSPFVNRFISAMPPRWSSLRNPPSRVWGDGATGGR